MRFLLPLLLLTSVVRQPENKAMPQPATSQRATGSFDVKITMLPSSDLGSGANRITGEKQYRGDLEGSGRADMLGAGDPKTGNAGIVGIERVTGKLAGRSGSFMLQHSGSMTNGTQNYNVTIIPGTGTEGFAGITGTMTIRIEAGGKHFYDLDYSLPATK